MDDLDDLQASEFVTDTEDQDSLDEIVDTEQRLRNQQLWASFQNAACCITRLYNDRTQPNISPWVPFQNAASNLTTLYRDCIESQRRFARLGYQVGRRKRARDIDKLLKKHKLPNTRSMQAFTVSDHVEHAPKGSSGSNIDESSLPQQQHNNVASILAVNQLNLGCNDSPSASMQAQPPAQAHHLTGGQRKSVVTDDVFHRSKRLRLSHC